MFTVHFVSHTHLSYKLAIGRKKKSNLIAHRCVSRAHKFDSAHAKCDV